MKLWRRLMHSDDRVDLPSDITLEQVRGNLFPQIVADLKKAGADHIEISEQTLSFRNGCFSSRWPPAETVTWGELSAGSSDGGVVLHCRASYRDNFVRLNLMVVAGVAFMALLGAISDWSVFAILPFAAMAWWLFVVLLGIEYYKTAFRHFVKRTVYGWCLVQCTTQADESNG